MKDNMAHASLWDKLSGPVTFLVLLFCISLRLVPALFLGVPYLPDPWVHIRKADGIIQLGRFNLLGDYDDRYPGINILIGLLSTFLGLDTATVGWIFFPLLTSLSLVFIYLLMRRLTGNNLIALVSVMVLGFAGPLTLIMGTIYKEGLSRLFLSTALFAFVARDHRKPAQIIPALVVLVATIPTHHFTMLVAGSIIIFVMLSIQVYDHRNGTSLFRIG